MNFKKLAPLSILLPCLLLSGCHWWDDDGSPEVVVGTPVVLTGKGVITAEHAYIAGGNDDYNDVLTSKGLSTAKKVSLLMSVDEDSKIVGVGDTNGFIEIEVNLTYQAAEDVGTENQVRATMRLLQDGPDSMVAQHRLTKSPGGTISNRIPVTVDWYSPTILSIEWNEAEQKLTYSMNETAWDIHLSDFINLPDVGAYTFDPASLKDVSVITTVRNMDVEGESGYMKVYLDELSVDDVVYDDFNSSNDINATKWDRIAESF